MVCLRLARCAGLRLIVVHSHFRPGGVRRVIEAATVYLVKALRPAVDEVLLVGGDAPETAWEARFRAKLGKLRLRCSFDSALHYFANCPSDPQSLARRIRGHLQRVLGDATPANCVVWAHNLGLGRNLLLTQELNRLCQTRKIPLVAHHHDWWFDNRWQRWPEMRRAGFRTLKQVAKTVFVFGPNIRHIAINQADAALLQRHFGQQADWLPNLIESAQPSSGWSARATRCWLRRQLGSDAAVWLMPCRLLRRKNIAEALLLARWLRPEAWLVTTGGISSKDEQIYAARLQAAARQHGWYLRLGLLQGDRSNQPGVAELMAVSEAVLLTSLQEGFGLPYLEAVAAQRPLIARLLPNIAPDLARFWFRFPQSYEQLLVDSCLFDWDAERRRKTRLLEDWKQNVPRSCHRWLHPPSSLVGLAKYSKTIPFSSLTLTAQLEILAQPVDKSWAACCEHNSFLGTWRERAAAGRLRLARWPRQADRWLSGKAYARRFQAILSRPNKVSLDARKSVAAQRDFIRDRLSRNHVFPLLWSRDT